MASMCYTVAQLTLAIDLIDFLTLYSFRGISGFLAGGFLSKFSINFLSCVISRRVGTSVFPGCLSQPSLCQTPLNDY